MKTRLLAMGGGGFSMEPDNPKLDQFLLSLSSKAKPNICFLGTASGDAEGYIEHFYSAFKNQSCTPAHLSLFKAPKGNLRDFVLEQDIFYVGGGNTRNLLVLWKEWGLDQLLFEAWKKGAVLAGISAGSICWFEEGLTDSVTGKLLPLKALGFIKGSNCPHFDGEPLRRPAYLKFIGDQEMRRGIACDDGVAAYYEDGQLVRVVSSRPMAKAYSLSLSSDGELIEEVITPELL
jgi:dipeptidase E